MGNECSSRWNRFQLPFEQLREKIRTMVTSVNKIARIKILSCMNIEQTKQHLVAWGVLDRYRRIFRSLFMSVSMMWVTSCKFKSNGWKNSPSHLYMEFWLNNTWINCIPAYYKSSRIVFLLAPYIVKIIWTNQHSRMNKPINEGVISALARSFPFRHFEKWRWPWERVENEVNFESKRLFCAWKRLVSKRFVSKWIVSKRSTTR